jgi:hypothetical protein
MFEFPRAATDSTGVPGGCSGQEAAAQACWPIHSGRSWWAHHRIFTGWLDVSSDGTAVYAPHNSKRVCHRPARTAAGLAPREVRDVAGSPAVDRKPVP